MLLIRVGSEKYFVGSVLSIANNGDPSLFIGLINEEKVVTDKTKSKD